MLVSWHRAAAPAEDTFTNTLYFNVSPVTPIDPTGYQALVDDLAAIYAARTFTNGRDIEVRAYDMDDAMPRPEKAYKKIAGTGSAPQGPGQVALCLSYYADRNLPSQRGRIYIGPWETPALMPTTPQLTSLQTLANALAGLGGANVDWSLFSPKKQTHTRLTNWWVDDSWDILRSRKLDAVGRISGTING